MEEIFKDIMSSVADIAKHDIDVLTNRSFFCENPSLRDGFTKLDNAANLLVLGMSTPPLLLGLMSMTAVCSVPLMALLVLPCGEPLFQAGGGLFGSILWIGVGFAVVGVLAPAYLKIAAYTLAATLGVTIASVALWVCLRTFSTLIGLPLFLLNEGAKKVSSFLSSKGIYSHTPSKRQEGKGETSSFVHKGNSY